MKHAFILITALALAPVAAFAMPVVGDVVGTNAADATAALEKLGCKVSGFENEDGKVEAVCADVATGAVSEVMIDPKTGAVTGLKQGD
jgi:beta-lactam-binding protein with PASTA domain